jgi:hypothetical protein
MIDSDGKPSSSSSMRIGSNASWRTNASTFFISLLAPSRVRCAPTLARSAERTVVGLPVRGERPGRLERAPALVDDRRGCDDGASMRSRSVPSVAASSA